MQTQIIANTCTYTQYRLMCAVLTHTCTCKAPTCIYIKYTYCMHVQTHLHTQWANPHLHVAQKYGQRWN